tara:strand:- start:475 stop:807 length:333 start_codon:yes stop_codon:yes gene_type:complete
MIDTNKYEGHTPMWYLEGTKGVWRIESDFTTHDAREVAILWTQNEADAQLIADAPDLLIEVKRLREENEKQNNVLTTLDEMIQRSEEHVELMKALEQGLGLPETWKEMIE